MKQEECLHLATNKSPRGLTWASDIGAGFAKCMGPVAYPLDEVAELRCELAGLCCVCWFEPGNVFVEYAPSLNKEASGGGSRAYSIGDNASYTVPGLADWYEAF